MKNNFEIKFEINSAPGPEDYNLRESKNLGARLKKKIFLEIFHLLIKMKIW